MSVIRVEPRYSECVECVHYDPARLRRVCVGCKVGENFEPKIDDEEPSEATLYDMLKEWSREDA